MTSEIKKDPLLPDWSSLLSKANEALKHAEASALARDWDGFVESLGDARQQVDLAFYWVVKREIVEGS